MLAVKLKHIEFFEVKNRLHLNYNGKFIRRFNLEGIDIYTIQTILSMIILSFPYALRVLLVPIEFVLHDYLGYVRFLPLRIVLYLELKS